MFLDNALQGNLDIWWSVASQSLKTQTVYFFHFWSWLKGHTKCAILGILQNHGWEILD